MIFIDPLYQPIRALPVAVPPKPTFQKSLGQLDSEIIAVLRDAPEPVGTWTLISEVARLSPANSRTEKRIKRLEILARVSALIRAGQLRRVGRAYLTLA